MNRLKKELKHLFDLINEPEMKILPAHLAFFMVLSIIPIITLVAYAATIFKVPISSFIGTLQGVLPHEVSDILLPIINGEGLNLTVGISMIMVFFLASNGTHSIIVASNTMYGIEHSNYLVIRIKALIIIVIMLLLIIFNLLVLGFGNNIVHWILELKILSNVSRTLYEVFVLFKWPVALIFIFLLVKLVYTIAPDAKIPSRYTNKGAIFTTVFWSLATVIYSFYVTNFTNYNLFYGSLTNIIVMMIWVYILSYILVFGMAINASNYKTDISISKNLNNE